MKRKFLNVILFSALMIGAAGTFTACEDYDDDIQNLQQQIDENVKSIQAINSLISSGSVITGVSNNGNGITITLSNGSSYDITNGANGANGKDAVVWSIGEDGYWYKDGVKQDYKAVGQDGAPGKDGVDGAPGKDGQDGAPGKDGQDGAPGKDGQDGAPGKDGQNGADGLYYVPNAETGNFDIYYANGTFKEATNISWHGTGITAVETEDDVILYNVTMADGTTNSVTISKSNNLRSLVFIPQVYVDGVQGLTYDSYAYKALTLSTPDSKNEKTTEAAESTTINPVVYAEYHVNPANANINELKSKLSFIVKKDVDYLTTRAAASKDFAMTPEFVSFKDGVLKVKVNIKGIAATEDKISVFALNVEKENGENVTSDYATVFKKDLSDLAIADPQAEAEKKSISDKDEHYRTKINAVDAAAYNQKSVWESGTNEAESKAYCDTVLVYNQSLDLTKCVEAHEMPCEGGDKIKVADLGKLGLTFAFDVVKNYKIGTPETDQTDQADFAKVADGVLTAKVFETDGRAAIGRTPIVRVKLMHGEEIVKVAYIKVFIADEISAPPVTTTYKLTVEDFEYNCDAAPVSNLTTVKDMNVQVYNRLGLSKDEFHAKYPYFYDYGANQAQPEVGTCEETTDAETQATHLIKWTISKDDLWENANKTLTHHVRYYAGENQTGAYIELELEATVAEIKKSYNVEKANFIAEYWDANKTNVKFNVAVPNTGDDDAANCTFVNDLNSPFTTWPKNSKEGVAGVLKLDKAVTGIKYFFADGIKDIHTVGGIDVAFTKDAEGTKLYATVEGVKETVATIDNAGSDNPNTVTYNKESAIAKQLLNTGEMYTYIGAEGRVCDDETKKVTITFDNKDYFQANFIRPINIAGVAADNFIDGVDFGEKGSFIRKEDLIAPSDWRGRVFSKYPNYWGYYGVSKITVDVDNAKCSLNSGDDKIPVTVELQENDATTMGSGTDAKTSKYGFITYKNNGTQVSAFEIYVKVTVEYAWGTIETDFITVPVSSTIGNN